MCGIIAAASNRNVGKLLVQGLHKMEYRGYDSAGIALHQKDQIAHLRTLGKVKLLEDKMIAEKPKSKLGIAHTRWATHGEPSEENAHPHKSNDRVYIVHNGIIENYLDLKEFLKKEGYTFSSQTDSELIAHLLEYFLSMGNSMIDSMYLTKEKLDGAYAIAAIDREDDQNIVNLYFLKMVMSLNLLQKAVQFLTILNKKLIEKLHILIFQIKRPQKVNMNISWKKKSMNNLMQY